MPRRGGGRRSPQAPSPSPRLPLAICRSVVTSRCRVTRISLHSAPSRATRPWSTSPLRMVAEAASSVRSTGRVAPAGASATGLSCWRCRGASRRARASRRAELQGSGGEAGARRQLAVTMDDAEPIRYGSIRRRLGHCDPAVRGASRPPSRQAGDPHGNWLTGRVDEVRTRPTAARDDPGPRLPALPTCCSTNPAGRGPDMDPAVPCPEGSCVPPIPGRPGSAGRSSAAPWRCSSRTRPVRTGWNCRGPR